MTDEPTLKPATIKALLGHETSLTTGSAVQALLNTIPDLVWLKDEHGVYRLCNTAYERFFGAPISEIVGKNDYDFVEQSLADTFRQHDLRAIECGKPCTSENWITFADDGYTGLFQTIKSPIYDANGAFVGVLGIARDITQSHDAKKRLEERQALLQSIVDLAGSAIALVDPDTGAFVVFNDAACSMLGYSRNDYSELTLCSIDADLASDVVLKKLRATLSEGNSTFEGSLRHKDGHHIDVLVTSSVIELGGKPLVETLWTDISELKRSEREVRRREAMLARTEQLAQVGSWEWHLTEGQVYWSAELCNLFMLEPDSRVPSFDEEGLSGFYHEEDYPRLKAAIEKAITGREPYELELRIKRKDGEVRTCLAYGEPECDETGKVIRLIGYLRDLTRQREAERELYDSQRELSQAQAVAETGSWSINPATGMLKWSEQACRIFGVSPTTDADFEMFLQRVYPDDREVLASRRIEALAGGRYSLRYRVVVDNRIKWVQERAEFEVDSSGRLSKGLGVLLDITKQWQDHLMLEATTKALQLLSQDLELEEILNEVIHAGEVINPGIIYSLMLLDPSLHEPVIEGSIRLPPAYTTLLQAQVEELVIKLSLMGDPEPDAQLSVPVLVRAPEELSELAAGHGFASVWAFPLRGPEGRVAGIFLLHFSREGEPNANDTSIIQQLSGLVLRVIEQARTRDALRLSSRAIEFSHSGIVVTDTSGIILDVNPAYSKMTGYSKQELLGQRPSVLKSGWQSDLFYRQFWSDIEQEGYWRGELWNKRKDGSYYAEWLTVSALRDGQGNITHYIGISDDITESKAAVERIQFLAFHDPLTALPNSQLARERVGQAINQVKRDNKGSFALVLIDLDQFKAVNVAFGYTLGDELLRQVAHRLLESVRESDTVSRQGDDEFMVIITQDASMLAVSGICTKLLQVLSKSYQLNEHQLSISASIGVAMYPEDGQDYDDLMKKADLAVNSVKEAGRNSFRFFNEQMNSDVMQHVLLRNGLIRALEQSEFLLYYQPQVDMRTGQVIGLEALIRWNNPEFGLVSPADFIPVAESTGLIVEMGAWVLREACRQLKTWREALGVADLVMAINISAVQFTIGDLFKTVEGVLEEFEIPPNVLELELTESVLLKEASTALDIISRLHRLGVKMSIDDFGTGFSSFAYLKKLPVDRLKIDRSFVMDITTNEDDAAIANAIVSLSHILGLNVIAEGVEDDDQVALLTKHGCDQYQGFLFSRPLAADDCEHLLRRAIN